MEQKTFELEGRDKEELIEQCLKDISKDREEVDIEILEEKKNFFGRVKKYRILVKCKDSLENDCLMEKADLKEKEEAKPLFKISNLDDGVYINLNPDREKLTLETIIDVVDLYGVKDYSMESLRKGYSEYSGLPFKIAEEQSEEMNTVSYINFNTADKMKSYILILEDCKKNAEEIVEEVSQEIKRPIYLDSIEKALNKKIHNEPILISEGIPPKNGEDGYIDYKFHVVVENSPRIKTDGSVDFKELGLISTVEADTIVAEKIPPTEGEDGENVLGEAVEHKRGKEAVFNYGNNLKLIEDGSKLVSEVGGQVKLENEKINVYEVYEIKGNVDNSVGNIDFNGSVLVRGNVQSGFSIKCTGDLEVDGVVESSKIESKGNVVVKRGVLGDDKCQIESEASVYSKYIENAYIFAEDLIESEMILHSSIVSRKRVVASGKKGAIMGGKIRSKEEVRAKTIGAPMATPTILEVGIDPHLKRENEILRKGMESVENDVYKLEKVIEHLKGPYDSNRLDEKKRSMYENAVETKRELELKLLDMESMSEKHNYEKTAVRGRVVFSDTIHPGVKVVMGDSVYQVDEDISRGSMYRDQFSGQIKVGPYIEE